MERIVGSDGDVLVKIEMPVEGLNEPAKIRFDEEALVDTIFSAAHFRRTFWGTKEQARTLARRMAAGQDLYAACQNALWLLKTYGRETDEMHQSIVRFIEEAIGYADGTIQIKAETYRTEGK